MTERTLRNHAPPFREKVALAALKGEKTLAELAQQFDAHPNQITAWRRSLWMAPLKFLAWHRRLAWRRRRSI